MSKRVVIGEIGSGNYGMRVATAGNDAINGTALQTSDKLSFDTLYPSAGMFIDRIYDITVNANSTHTASYGKTYSPFPFIYGTYKNGNTYISDLFSQSTIQADSCTSYQNALAGTTLGEGFYWETTATTLKVFNNTSSQKVFRLFVLTLGATGSAPVTLPNAPTFQSPKTDNLTATSFRIRFNAGGGTTDETRADVSTEQDFSSGMVVTNGLATDPYTVSGLTSGVIYHYRLRSVDTTPNPDLYSAYIQSFQKTPGVEDDCGIPASNYTSSDLAGNGDAQVVLNWANNGDTFDTSADSHTTLANDWFIPNTTGIGSSYWIRFTENSYTAATGGYRSGASTGTWLAMSSQRAIGVGMTTTSQITKTASRGITVEISSSSSGSPVVASKTFSMSASASTGFGGTDCIHEDMLIATEEDMKSIHDIQLGDKVVSHNFETGEDELVEVTDTVFVERSCVRINDLTLTADHYVHLEGGRKASANPPLTEQNYGEEVDQIKIGDKMVKLDGSFEEVETILELEGTHTTFALETKYNNFYANGYLVDSVILSKNKS